MPHITWQFSTTDNEVSAVIRWKTDSEISHVDVITPEGKLLGATGDGTRIREPNYETFRLRIEVEVPVTLEQYNKFWSFMNSQIGGTYDFAGIAGIALGRNICAPADNFCSELQARGVNIFPPGAGIVWVAKDPSKVDPELLRVVLTAIPGAKERRNPPTLGTSSAWIN
jgi:hypothetical protein